MWLSESSPLQKRDLVLSQPFVNVPGTLGFAPDPHRMPFLAHLGAFFTNPVSRRPRQPARNRIYLPFPGGVLLHTGLPNPGISRVIARFRKAWAEAPLPIIPHLLAEHPQTLSEMVRKLEGLENVQAVSLGIPPDCNPAQLEDFTAAALGELPVILNLSSEQLALLDTVTALQPSAVLLASPRGTLRNERGEWITGRLYGPSTTPTLLKALITLKEANLDVIASGGIYTREQAQAFLDAGATAVSLGLALWGVNLEGLFLT